MKFSKKLGILLLILGFYAPIVLATPIKILSSKWSNENLPTTKIINLIQENYSIEDYRAINVQVIYTKNLLPEHLLVYLFSKKYHRVDIQSILVDKNFNKVTILRNYKLSEEDLLQQPGISEENAKCPDDNIEFIAFAPNDMDLEQDITIDVAKAATQHGLKTISLLKEDATRSNYINYMTCPKLKGNFYDGDANPEVITTYDGIVSYRDINKYLKTKFRYQVTNIWLACQAYNDPIKSSVIEIAQTQKYAAGINNLLVGPSDRAAACTMKAALDGKPMTDSFNQCYKIYDVEEDIWGFGGQGADIFGT